MYVTMILNVSFQWYTVHREETMPNDYFLGENYFLENEISSEELLKLKCWNYILLLAHRMKISKAIVHHCALMIQIKQWHH